MMQRKYSVDEIDQMRGALIQIYRLHSSTDVRTLEERLRTFMLNGTEPEELVKRLSAMRREAAARMSRKLTFVDYGGRDPYVGAAETAS